MSGDMLPTVNWLMSLDTTLSPLKCDTTDVGRRCRRNWLASVVAEPHHRASSLSSPQHPTATTTTFSPYRRPTPSYGAAPRYFGEGPDHTEDGEELDVTRPPFSFTCLIGLAILSSEQKRLNVGSIYEYICRNFPYFLTARCTWRNSVRHVLSLNKFFQKPDGDDKAAKGGVWQVKSLMLTVLVEHIAEGQQRLPPATAKHLGLPDLKRWIVKSRIGKSARRGSRGGGSSLSSSSSSLGSSTSSFNSSTANTSMLSAAALGAVPILAAATATSMAARVQSTPLPPLLMELSASPEPYTAGRAYTYCPSPTGSISDDLDSIDGDASLSSSHSSIEVPDLSQVELDADCYWPLGEGGQAYGMPASSSNSAAEDMIDAVLAKLAAEDEAANAGADSRMMVVGHSANFHHYPTSIVGY